MRHIAEDRSSYPAVGDWVAVQTRPAEGTATIHAILERLSKFSRKSAGDRTSEQVLAANIETALLMSSINHDLNERRIERYLTMVWQSGARPVILLNKADLSTAPEAPVRRLERMCGGVSVHAVSALTGQGLGELATYMTRGSTLALLGSSGVGKSTLVNRLSGVDLQAVGPVREGDGRGRHVTTHRQLFVLPGGATLIDTPGLREIQLWDADAGLKRSFEDLENLGHRCRFRNCRHETEPGCAIRAALADGALDPLRLESYRKLQRELAYLARRQDDLAMLAEKREWKRIHRAFNRERRRR